MRIAEDQLNRPLFTLSKTLRSRAPCMLLAEPPFTRSVGRAGFRPARDRWRASSGRETSYRLLQYVRCTGTYRERTESSHAAEREVTSLPSLGLRPPPLGDGTG